MQNPAKFEEKGNEALATGFFKWSKDYVSAAINFDQAAQIYKTQANYDRAIVVFEKLVTVNKQMGDNWAVARAYENIIDCQFLKSKEKFEVEKLISLCDLAVDNFAMGNSMNTLYNLMDKIGK